jgi:POT family proton-dependent oligopeptide transporter
MAAGALVVATAYVLIAAVSTIWASASWAWLILFFAIFTYGELFILPTGLGLFARLAPKGLGATTVAAWYLAIFAGSLFAGLVGTLWSRMSHPLYFLLLAAIAGFAALLLRLIDPRADLLGAESVQGAELS